jgi:hypothetical protein
MQHTKPKTGEKIRKTVFLKEEKSVPRRLLFVTVPAVLQQKMRPCERKEATELARIIPRKTHQRRHATHVN